LRLLQATVRCRGRAFRLTGRAQLLRTNAKHLPVASKQYDHNARLTHAALEMLRCHAHTQETGAALTTLCDDSTRFACCACFEYQLARISLSPAFCGQRRHRERPWIDARIVAADFASRAERSYARAERSYASYECDSTHILQLDPCIHSQQGATAVPSSPLGAAGNLGLAVTYKTSVLLTQLSALTAAFRAAVLAF